MCQYSRASLAKKASCTVWHSQSCYRLYRIATGCNAVLHKCLSVQCGLEQEDVLSQIDVYSFSCQDAMHISVSFNLARLILTDFALASLFMPYISTIQYPSHR